MNPAHCPNCTHVLIKDPKFEGKEYFELKCNNCKKLWGVQVTQEPSIIIKPIKQ